MTMLQAWERHLPLYALTLDQATTLLHPVLPHDRAVALQALTGGLRNTLYRVTLADAPHPVVLRLYTADPVACARETAIARLVAHDVPVPKVLYSDPQADPPYAVVAWSDGLRFTELLAAGDATAIGGAARSAGAILASLQRHRFPRAGEFGPTLEVVAPSFDADMGLAAYLEQALQRERVRTRLGEATVTAVRGLLRRCAHLLEDDGQAPVLIHADFKPENLLVQQTPAGWQVAAVLDWEFAFAGSRLFDAGLFLRRAPWLPPSYRDQFAAAFSAGSEPLPTDWLTRARLIDLVNLLWFLGSADDRPALIADVCNLVTATVQAHMA